MTSPLEASTYQGDLGWWEMASRPARPRLRAHAHGYTGYREETALPLRRREVPSSKVPLIISFGAPIRLAMPGDPGRDPATFTSFLAGPHDRAVLTEHAGTQYGVQVDLTPLGAYAMLGTPMRELTNAAVGLIDLLGNPAEKLTARLAESVTWEARFTLLDEVLTAWVDAGPTPSPPVAWAWRRLRQAEGHVSIGRLADEVGWSRRHLVARFHEQVGLPPKTMARVLRFQRALRMLTEPAPRPLVDVAVASGYYDQAHFNRDFREFAGCAPTDYLAARLPDGAGVAGVVGV
ncbi:MAG: helix-turn-helix domain-containing protein [Streptosporangiales bacterium]|nr:helix-turn-helix domain-containing protein [Streptosporangiales bacterium]